MIFRAVVGAAGAILLLGVYAAGAGERVGFLTLHGGAHHQFSSGRAEEYVLGENDFPVIPAHTGIVLGFSYLETIGRMFGAEIDIRFIGASSVVLTDPSDRDTVKAQAGPHGSIALNGLFAPFHGSVRPYLLTGGGLDASLAGNASYVTRYGYVIDVPAPAFKERFDVEVHAGAGVLVVFKKKWGFRLEIRYGWIFDEPRTLDSASGSAGAFLSF